SGSTYQVRSALPHPPVETNEMMLYLPMNGILLWHLTRKDERSSRAGLSKHVFRANRQSVDQWSSQRIR
ncbi:hypothetical protein P7L87_26470, partial [Vibrio parahaemolyticus]|nr:hypothetical protein [Vibrio parahaemolyticus]